MMIGKLLVSRPGLVEDDAVEVVHYYGSSIVSFFLDVKCQVLSGKMIRWQYYFFFPQLCAVGQLLVHPLSRIVFHLKDKKLP
jgi:hypothetical protein